MTLKYNEFQQGDLSQPHLKEEKTSERETEQNTSQALMYHSTCAYQGSKNMQSKNHLRT